MKLIGSVGKKGINLYQDIELVKNRFKELNFNFTSNLNSFRGYELIKFFQSIIHNYELNKKDKNIDGRIDPGYITEKWLFSDDAPKIIQLGKINGLLTYPFRKTYILSWYYYPLKRIITNCYKIYKEEVYIYTKLSTKKIVNDYSKIYIFIREKDEHYKYIYNSLGREFIISKEKIYIVIERLIKLPNLKEKIIKRTLSNSEKINDFIKDSKENEELIKKPITTNKNTAIKYKWLEIAKKEIGIKEKPGNNNNKRILEYLETCSSQYKTDEIPWCAAFLKWCFKKSGLSTFKLSAAARSFSQSSSLVKLNEPYYGSIVVFKYNNNTRWSGHVGILIDIVNNNLKILGGNQSNQVKYSYFSLDKVYGYYWPSSVQLPTISLINNKKNININTIKYINTR